MKQKSVSVQQSRANKIPLKTHYSGFKDENRIDITRVQRWGLFEHPNLCKLNITKITLAENKIYLSSIGIWPANNNSSKVIATTTGSSLITLIILRSLSFLFHITNNPSAFTAYIFFNLPSNISCCFIMQNE